MSSLPRAGTFRWTFTAPADSNNVSTTIPIPADQTVSNGTHSRLAYVADTEKDFGELRCFAKNELGESEAPCRFKLVAAGKQHNLGFVVLKCIQSLPFLRETWLQCGRLVFFHSRLSLFWCLLL